VAPSRGVRIAVVGRDWGVVIAVASSASAEERYAEAYASLWPDVFRFALSWTNDWSAAEDIAQEAFARLWRDRDRLDWDRPVLPWLLTAARRLAQDRFRALRRRIAAAVRAGSHVQGPATLDEGVADRWLDLRDALAVLGPAERTALLLTTVEGRDYDDAADLLGTTPGALRAAVSRARRKLEDAR
jgi:RNA polymerase sigma-70 factor, ECF subfamily